MAGGAGSRLWPLSRELFPKQFLRLSGVDTMLQSTLRRLDGLPHQAPLIICNEDHRFIAAEQLRQGGFEHSGILLEPFGRNTAPAIALAALSCWNNREADESDPLLLVLAADHVIENDIAFIDAVTKAKKLAESGKLVTFGIIPTRPETGYGYIKKGAPIEGASSHSVDSFVEKPDFETAQDYIKSGDYLWNSGMFLFKTSTLLSALKKYCPEILNACADSLGLAKTDLDFIRLDPDSFSKCPNDSIDYAIMEKTPDAAVIPLDAGWNDIGSWTALWDVSKKDKDMNVCIGDVISNDVTNCYLHSEGKLIAAVGLDNVIVVDTQDAVLVANKDHVQKVKNIVTELKDKNRSEFKLHKEAYKVWGKQNSIDSGGRDKVNRLTVKPGERVTSQQHHHRAEHWIVVAGTAKVTISGKSFLLTENESTYIPIGELHSLENPGKIPLEIIEVQTGQYLGEDDIVRFEDRTEN